MDAPLEQARSFFLQGLAHYEAGAFVDAERAFAAALSLAPGRPSVLTNLGATRLKLGHTEAALADLQQALAQEPGDPQALGHAGIALAELGRLEQALAHFDRALAAQAAAPALWMQRGNVLRELGRRDEAAASYRESMARGGDAELNGYYLAGVTQAPVPGTAPRGYVENLFDHYAADFDAHVTRSLGYQAPRVLGERLLAGGRRFRHALDLGCGTGLCGPFLRRGADRVTGVDLSAQMLDRAQATGAYDELVHADVAAFLAAAAGPFDAVVAADVFIYVGALDGVFGQLARVMPARAVFGFTVEESTGDELVLRPSLRYAHSEAGLRRLAEAHGFAVQGIERAPVRQDQQQPVAGLFVWMERA